jgi:hypothetical protein
MFGKRQVLFGYDRPRLGGAGGGGVVIWKPQLLGGSAPTPSLVQEWQPPTFAAPQIVTFSFGEPIKQPMLHDLDWSPTARSILVDREDESPHFPQLGGNSVLKWGESLPAESAVPTLLVPSRRSAAAGPREGPSDWGASGERGLLVGDHGRSAPGKGPSDGNALVPDWGTFGGAKVLQIGVLDCLTGHSLVQRYVARSAGGPEDEDEDEPKEMLIVRPSDDDDGHALAVQGIYDIDSRRVRHAFRHAIDIENPEEFNPSYHLAMTPETEAELRALYESGDVLEGAELRQALLDLQLRNHELVVMPSDIVVAPMAARYKPSLTTLEDYVRETGTTDGPLWGYIVADQHVHAMILEPKADNAPLRMVAPSDPVPISDTKLLQELNDTGAIQLTAAKQSLPWIASVTRAQAKEEEDDDDDDSLSDVD